MTSRFPHRLALWLFLVCALAVRQLPAQTAAPDPTTTTASGDDPSGTDDTGDTDDADDPDPTASTDPTTSVDPGIYSTTVAPASAQRPNYRASAAVGQPFTYQIKPDSNKTQAPSSYSMAEVVYGGIGGLGSLSIDPNTGLIFGTPTTPGVYTLEMAVNYKRVNEVFILSLTVYADPVPTVTILRQADAATTTEGLHSGVFVLTRTGGDLLKSTVVHYSVTGSALSGVDYKYLHGKVKFKKGELIHRIWVHPKHRTVASGVTSTVRITLHTGKGYLLGERTTAKLNTPGRD